MGHNKNYLHDLRVKKIERNSIDKQPRNRRNDGIMQMNPSKSSQNTVTSLDKSSCFRRCLCCAERSLIWLCGRDYTRNRRRFWCVLGLFIVSLYVMCLANVATEYRSMKHPCGNISLPDVGFDFADHVTPQIGKLIKIPDIAVPVALSITALWLIFDGPKKQKLPIFRRFFTITSIMYLLRSICVLSTQLPNPFQTDDPLYHQKWSSNIGYEALLALLRIKATNNDVFFSGHTILISMCAMMLSTYCRRKWMIALFWLYALFVLYVIIATKFHYTIDVVIGFALTVIIWKCYHLALSVEKVRNHHPIFKYFESDRESYRKSPGSGSEKCRNSGSTSFNTLDSVVVEARN